jgi:hypothetical protein
MTQEQLRALAERVYGPLQWLTPEEEWLVMEIVARMLQEKRRRNQ